jgi:putative DNA primase/helicase
MRGKWEEREDYRSATLTNAVNLSSAFYAPIATSAAEDFDSTTTYLAELDPANNKRYSGGDIGFGRLFADMYKDIARYVPERKKWYIFDGKRWVADIGSLKAMELAKELCDALIVYTAGIKDESRRDAYLKFCKQWNQRRFRETYLKESQSVYPVSMERFDADRYLLNCNNGTLDLRTMEFREHRPEDFLTKMTSVDYIPSATSPRFDKFIEEITSNDKDKALFLQKSLGYGISGDTRYECLFFLYGKLTRNGKGTLMESCLSVLGDYGRAVRPETIAQKNNTNSQAPSEDIARLAGIRFANISEPSRGLLLNAAQVKSMTGNDTLNARFLNENSFDFKPQFKLYINTNYLPVISDMTLFHSGRVIIIPFERHFEEWEQDRTLKEEFSKPATQSAILNWLVNGYQLLRKEGFTLPQSVVDAIADYSHESDKMAQFTEERLEADSNAEVRTSVLYDDYRTWCYGNGCYCENSRNFINELRKFGTVERRRPKSGGEKTTLLIGYKLRPHPDDFLK